MPWFKVSCNVPSQILEDILKYFEAQGAISTRLTPGNGEALFEPVPRATVEWKSVRVEAMFPLECSIANIREIVQVLNADSVDAGFVADENWEEKWKKDVQVLQFVRLWVVPREYPLLKDQQVVRIDPGLAFGTGSHSTTRLCLKWLSRIDLSNKSVLDFGCGSGILSIAAKKLGAASVLAVDYDEQALRATSENAAFNGEQVELSESIAGTMRFDVIVANILLNTLVDYSDTLSGLLVENGQIGLSGLLSGQSEAIASAYPAINFEAPMTCDEWVLMSGIKVAK